MPREVRVLMVSSRLENKQALLRILKGLPVDIITAGNLGDAEEAIRHHGIDMVICEDRLTDGTYHDVLMLVIDKIPKVQFVVLQVVGGWLEQQEALQLGAAEVVRCPLHATDVELALIHTIQKNAAATHAVT